MYYYLSISWSAELLAYKDGFRFFESDGNSEIYTQVSFACDSINWQTSKVWQEYRSYINIPTLFV